MRYHSEQSADEGIRKRKMWESNIRRRKASDRNSGKTE
jgi:hypothetical protein